MNIFEAVKDRCNIVQVYQDITGESIPQNKIEIKVKCQVNNEKTPSLFINSVRNIFNCFSCGAGGAVIDLVMHETTITEPIKAANWLVDKYNIEYESIPRIKTVY
ncbi:MAG: CHC2 zinc finger domain-containing protein [Halanaerobiales bacterium]